MIFPGLRWTQSFLRRLWKNRIPKLMHWLSAVARAAPEIPRFRPKIRIGSRIIFRIPPVVIPIME